MRAGWIAAGIGVGLLLVAGLRAPTARAGVPRACIHPQADPIECPAETRRVLLRVLPASRVRALARQRIELERTAPLQDRERNELIEQIRDRLRDRVRR
ncbi:MAG: hypothetical protein OEQ13_08525 [Acidobacteriota bacterium]|nr:hypothetical protein [Acidobacteriota bacterium]